MAIDALTSATTRSVDTLHEAVRPVAFPNMGVLAELQDWSDAGQRCRVALVGAGFVGRGLLGQLARAPGIDVRMVATRHPDAVDGELRGAGIDPSRTVITSDPAAVADRDDVDLVVEATGSLDDAADVMVSALRAGRDVVSFNAEVDATIGWLLHQIAAEHGAVYTIADGDQPGVLLRLLADVDGMGFVVTAALNCKRHLDVHQSPGTSQGYSRRDSTSVLMTTAFGDGTKMNIENAVVSNLTGLVPKRRGMHGVVTTLADVARDVAAVVDGDGAVDYTLGGDFGAGVGVVVRSPRPEVDASYLRYFKMGDGPHYFLFRPYHLVHFELATTLADVVVRHRALATPRTPPSAEVVAVAKRDLRPGARLDGIGGECVYGQVDTVAGSDGLLPVGLAHHATVRRPVRQDHALTLDDVELDGGATIVEYRTEQERRVR